MAIKKATTTDDIKEAEPVAEKGYTVVVGPAGYESTVPDSILDELLASGYKKK
jgi:hypothetical protein